MNATDSELDAPEEIILPEDAGDTVFGYAAQRQLRFVPATRPADILDEKLFCWEIAREERAPWTFLLMAYTQGSSADASLTEEAVFLYVRERYDFAPLVIRERLAFDEASASLVRAYRNGMYRTTPTLLPAAKEERLP